tara:strand:+ start:57987 stop:59318 length:1332 start_codon:yes stop_codon:yes gene_type:complete
MNDMAMFNFCTDPLYELQIMRYIVLMIVLAITVSCGDGRPSITDPQDYNMFLVSHPLETGSEYFKRWNSKIGPDSLELGSFGVVASEYTRYFKQTGDIQYLIKAEKALSKASQIAQIGKAGYQRALARNYLAQHRFSEALQLTCAARKIGGGVEKTHALFFDVHMELGNFRTARDYLDSIGNSNGFDYLVRMAKWKVHNGDLRAALKHMEKATGKAEATRNTGLILWSYTLLADYYGRFGQIERSYKHYLKALQLDPRNAHAKKGIAWIVFSFEKNPKEAMRIMDSVTKTYQAPDYYLLKAEIAAFEKDEITSLYNLDEYYMAVQNPYYGDMYNVYNVDLYVERTEQYERAFKLAKREVAKRPTPRSYGLLAYTYLKMGKKTQALQVVEQYVHKRSFEPVVLYHTAEIFKANGDSVKVKQLKKDLLRSRFQLGPLLEDKVLKL